MTTRSLSIAAAAGLLVTAAMLPQQASALPGAGVAEAQVRPGLVQQVGSKYNRRYYRDDGTYVRPPFAEVDTRRGTWVAAPFARVYSGRHGTYVRAPFVDLWVPR
ncbi:MAG TPA: hypothetical protein VI038_03435 [Methyloceanibacter sp.]